MRDTALGQFLVSPAAQFTGSQYAELSGPVNQLVEIAREKN